MVLECYTWIFHLFKQIIGDGDDYKLLEQKKRQILTSSGLNRIQNRPLILRYFVCYNYVRVSIIDGRSEKECEATGLKSLRRGYFVCCCNGLALFTSITSWSLYVVINPLSNETVAKIDAPHEGGGLCGFFFHPLAKEYRILYVWKPQTRNSYEYHLYLFGERKWRRTVNPYFSVIPKRSASDGQICVNGNPAVLNNALHWDIGEIMVFDMITEEFSIRSLPFERGTWEGCWIRRLLVKDDQLCFCQMGAGESVLDIWILDDYAKWSWTNKYVVNLHRVNRFPMEPGFSFNEAWNSRDNIRIISIQNNELVLFWKQRGMFSFRLGSNHVEKIYLKKSEMDSGIVHGYDIFCGFEAYTAAGISESEL